MTETAYTLKGDVVARSLESDVTKGLSSTLVLKRRRELGPNELVAKHKMNPVLIFFRQFHNFIIYILLFAVLVSLLSGEVADAIVICIILLFNAVFGFIQEFKAERALEALKKMSGLKARVIRDGKEQHVDTKDLVPGDILILEEGMKVPADARILSAVSLAVSEASLTGESVPVSKHDGVLKGQLALADRKNMLFSGTVVTRGRGSAVVTGTGMSTEIGKIAGMLTDVADEMTPLQEKLERFGKMIGIVTLIICALIFLIGVFKEGSYQTLFAGDFVLFVLQTKEWFLSAVSLAVAAVPEGLPAIVTISLALGVRRMVRRHVLIRRLPSVETLGETTVICSDKTGTLTRNEMTVRTVFTSGREFSVSGDGYHVKGTVRSGKAAAGKKEEWLFRIGALCNDATLAVSGKDTAITGDPTEAALLVSAEKYGIRQAKLRKAWKRIGEEPFDAMRKMMSTLHRDPRSKKIYQCTKGAPEMVIRHCSKLLVNGKVVAFTAAKKRQLLRKNESYAKGALRMLGFAYKQVRSSGRKPSVSEKDMIFAGLQGMIDPPHAEVKTSVARCAQAGIRVIMITGDNRFTAEGIAKEIGITGASMEGVSFAALSKHKQKTALKTTSIFSRVEPAHKMLIVDLLQEMGEVVAMTGDGVNDAPALKGADLGIAMGITGTDVAKESSDMVLQDDNFTSIVNAVEEGRGIYENIKKFVNYLLSCNLGEVFIIFFAILIGLPLPLTAIMLLWMNLITDGLPALALSVDPHPAGIMKRPPKKAREGIMDRSMQFNIVAVSILITASVLGLFGWSILSAGRPLEYAQTMAFTALIVMELVRLQAIRSEYKLSLLSNKYLVAAVLASLGLQLLVIYTPLNVFFGTVALSWSDWGLILLVSSAVYVLRYVVSPLKKALGIADD